MRSEAQKHKYKNSLGFKYWNIRIISKYKESSLNSSFKEFMNYFVGYYTYFARLLHFCF